MQACDLVNSFAHLLISQSYRFASPYRSRAETLDTRHVAARGRRPTAKSNPDGFSLYDYFSLSTFGRCFSSVLTTPL